MSLINENAIQGGVPVLKSYDEFKFVSMMANIKLELPKAHLESGSKEKYQLLLRFVP